MSRLHSSNKDGWLWVLSKSDLFGLLSTQTQWALFQGVIRFPWGDESSKFKAVSYLLKTGKAWLNPVQIQQLETIRKRIDFDKLLDTIDLDFRECQRPNHQLIKEFAELALTILDESEGSRLQKLFTVAKIIPTNFLFSYFLKIAVLEQLAHVLPFFPKEGRNAFFDLTIQIGQVEVKRSRCMPTAMIEIYQAVILNTACLGTEQLNILINFVLTYEGRPGYTELWCCLAYAAVHRDGRLHTKLTEAMTTRNKMNTLQGRMLQIDQLSREQHHCLLSEILAIDNKNEKKEEREEEEEKKKAKAAMLGLMGSLMPHMDAEVHSALLMALSSISKTLPAQATALCRAAASIVHLSEENGRLLLNNIETSLYPDRQVSAFRTVVNTVSKNVAGRRSGRALHR